MIMTLICIFLIWIMLIALVAYLFFKEEEKAMCKPKKSDVYNRFDELIEKEIKANSDGWDKLERKNMYDVRGRWDSGDTIRECRKHSNKFRDRLLKIFRVTMRAIISSAWETSKDKIDLLDRLNKMK